VNLELENQGGIQNQSKAHKTQIKTYLETESQKFLNNPKRKEHIAKREMIINDPDTLHSLINDPFENGN
jgi:hypothetical protein